MIGLDLIEEIIFDAGADVSRMLPFLFAAFLIIEALEHYSAEFTGRVFAKMGKAGPAAGAVAGCVPQCGFSVMAANLYAGGIISAGTLISVFVATSDEAVLVILGNPGQGKRVLLLLAVKLVIATAAGYGTDFFLGKYIFVAKESGNLCKYCGCHEQNAGILLPALRHTVKIFFYLLVFTIFLNLCVETIGMRGLSEYLLGDMWFQPAVAALIGLIPNCAASVMLTQLYLGGVISFGSVIAGLSTGAGVGLIVLFKMNRNKKENLKILGVLYLTGAAAGLLMELLF